MGDCKHFCRKERPFLTYKVCITKFRIEEGRSSVTLSMGDSSVLREVTFCRSFFFFKTRNHHVCKHDNILSPDY